MCCVACSPNVILKTKVFEFGMGIIYIIGLTIHIIRIGKYIILVISTIMEILDRQYRLSGICRYLKPSYSWWFHLKLGFLIECMLKYATECSYAAKRPLLPCVRGRHARKENFRVARIHVLLHPLHHPRQSQPIGIFSLHLRDIFRVASKWPFPVDQNYELIIKMVQRERRE